MAELDQMRKSRIAGFVATRTLFYETTKKSIELR